MRYIAAIIILFTVNYSYAQRYSDEPPEKKEVKSLLSENNEITGFGALDLKVGNLRGKEALIVGAYGGVIVNRTIMLGVAAYGISSSVTFDGTIPGSSTGDELNLYGGYAGLLLGTMLASKEVVHISIPVVIGVGNLEVSDDNFFSSSQGKDAKYTLESSNFFVVEPGIQLELNVSQTFRLGLGASYRIVTGTDLVNVQDSDIAGFAGMLSFKFGVF